MTTKEYMRCVTAVEPEWLAELGPMFFSINEVVLLFAFIPMICLISLGVKLCIQRKMEQRDQVKIQQKEVEQEMEEELEEAAKMKNLRAKVEEKKRKLEQQRAETRRSRPPTPRRTPRRYGI